LVGITRDSVLQLARRELGVEVEERPVDRSEIYQADEAFLCGTGAEISAIGEIDGRTIGDGSIGELTARVRDLYLRAARADLPGYDDWLTRVYESGNGPRERTVQEVTAA
jgi:branched-chain amino acid aminotransferase